MLAGDSYHLTPPFLLSPLHVLPGVVTDGEVTNLIAFFALLASVLAGLATGMQLLQRRQDRRARKNQVSNHYLAGILPSRLKWSLPNTGDSFRVYNAHNEIFGDASLLNGISVRQVLDVGWP